MSTSSTTTADKGKSRERLGTPVSNQQRARSSAPSPSPSAFPRDSTSPGPSSSRFGGGRTADGGDVARASSPLKRFGSNTGSSNGNNQVDSNQKSEDSALTGLNSNSTGQMRVTIIADPSISSAFKQEDDRELWELFLR